LYLRDDRADAPPSEAEEVDEIVVVPAEDAVSRSDVIEQVRRFAELLEEEHGTLEEFLEEEETYSTAFRELRPCGVAKPLCPGPMLWNPG